MRILVVEDDPKISDFLKIGLESEYFAVDVVTDGEEGLYLASTNEYDVMVLDSMLPHKGGLDVCKELRQKGILIPIMGLSVKSETSNKVAFLNAGADDYLTKPFSFEELIARIRALLRRPQEIQSDILEIGGLELDSKRHIVKRDGEEIYLTRKEFLLLEYLMKNQGTVLSRGMILEHVWDMNADPFSNTIETHIMTLRKKLDRERQSRLIQTVPGIGYKFDFS
jgi:two-component system, OmpR family, response regulator